MSEIELRSPAKINLHLEIGPLMNNGFHDLCSIFQIVSLSDTVLIRSLKDTNNCRVIGDFSCSQEKNLAYRACRLFCEHTGLDNGVEIRIDKKIPEGAGLGGGSSNAATVLIGMNRLFSAGLSDKELSALGSQLGSDIPFFCRGPLALVQGRGDIVEPIEFARIIPIVMVFPNFSVSTADAYRWFDAMNDGKTAVKGEDGKINFSLSAEKAVNMYNGCIESWKYFNSFTPVLEKRFPRIRELKEKFQDFGASFTEVSGSGSSMFALFNDYKIAEECANSLKGEKDLKQVLTIETLARFPSSILQ